MVCFTLIVGGHDQFHRYDCCQGYEEQQYEGPPVQLLVVSIPELVRLQSQFYELVGRRCLHYPGDKGDPEHCDAHVGSEKQVETEIEQICN